MVSGLLVADEERILLEARKLVSPPEVEPSLPIGLGFQSPRERKETAPMDHLERLIADIERLARRIGAVFVPDLEKIRAFTKQG